MNPFTKMMNMINRVIESAAKTKTNNEVRAAIDQQVRHELGLGKEAVLENALDDQEEELKRMAEENSAPPPMTKSKYVPRPKELKYYVPSRGENSADAVDIVIDMNTHPRAVIGNAGLELYAKVAAEFLFHDREGWANQWPLWIVLVDGGYTEVARYKVEMEMSPMFRVKEGKIPG